MVNSIQTIKAAAGVLAKAAAGELVDNLQFAKSISKADESDYKGKNGYSAGDIIYINKPARFIPTSSFDITSSIQDIQEEKVALPLDILSSVAISLDSQELASTIDLKSVYERAVKPAVQSIAQNIESTMLTRAVKGVSNLVGTAGFTIFDTDTMLASRQKLNQFLAPQGDRFALLNPAAERSAVNARKGYFNQNSAIASQYKDGVMGMADGYTYLSNNLIPTITNGNDVTGVAVESSVLVPATGASTLGVDGLTTTTGTVKAGSVFTVAGVNAVHPITKVDMGFLQQFVVTADATADGSGQATLSISPTIYSSASGSLQNVSALPADEAAITFIGLASTSYDRNLTFQRDAFRMVSVPLVLPTSAEFAVQETYKGFTVAIVRAFDVLKRRMITRVDFLGGFANVRPEWACQITS